MRQHKKHNKYPLSALVFVLTLSLNIGVANSESTRRPAHQIDNKAVQPGYGIGQMMCHKFIDAARRLQDGQDDGLFFAFLAWRDGYVTAASQSYLLLDKSGYRLLRYCQRHPQERFADAVNVLILRLTDIHVIDVRDHCVSCGTGRVFV